MLTLWTYDRTGALAGAQLEVTGLRWSTSYPGGYAVASFTLPNRKPGVDYPEIGYFYRVKVLSGTDTVFDGEIRVIKVAAGRGTGLECQAFGHQVLLTDDTYYRIWADNRLGNWGWNLEDLKQNAAQSAFYLPSLYTNDANGRLYLSAKAGEHFDNGVFAAWRYTMPQNDAGTFVAQDIKKLTFSYNTAFPVGSWEMLVYDRTNLSTLLSVTATTGSVGSETSASLTPAAGCKKIEIVLKSKQNQGMARRLIDDADSGVVYCSTWAEARNSVTNGFTNRGGTQRESNDTTTKHVYPDATATSSGKTTGASVAAGDTTITVSSSTGFAANDVIRIGTDAEYLRVTGAPTGTTLTVTRGVDGTAAAAHANGATIYTMSTRTGGCAYLEFTGESIAYFCMKGKNFGYADFLLFDGASLIDSSTNVDLYDTNATFENKAYEKTGLARKKYRLYVRVVGTKHISSTDYYVALDYLEIDGQSFVQLPDYREQDIYARIISPIVYTTTGTVRADDIAKDVVAAFSGASIGLASDTGLVASGSTRDLVPAVFDDGDRTGKEILDWVCSFGDQTNAGLGWAVWDEKRLELGLRPQTAVTYTVRATDAEDLSIGGSVQEIMLKGYATYRSSQYDATDALLWQGTLRTPTTTSSEAAAKYDGRTRTMPIASSTANDKTLAGNLVTMALADRDSPKMSAAIRLRRPVYDAAGNAVPLWMVRSGAIMQIDSLKAREAGLGGVADIRDSATTFLIVGTEYDVEQGVLTITPDGSRNDLERYLAAVQNLLAR